MKNLSQSTVSAFLTYIVLFFFLTSMSFKVDSFCEIQTECPTAAFFVANNGCVAPCEMVFMNCSQGAESYLWDFGDGITSTETNPRHTYNFVGNFTVRLIAFVEGCQSEHIIVVETIDF